MLALAPVPVDVMPTAPPSASPSPAGQEGLFAGHLKNATENLTGGTRQPSSPVGQADQPLPQGEQQVLTDTTAEAGTEQRPALDENDDTGKMIEAELLDTMAQATNDTSQPTLSVVTNLEVPPKNISEKRSTVTSSPDKDTDRNSFISSEGETTQATPAGDGLVWRELPHQPADARQPSGGLDRGLPLPTSFQERTQDNGAQFLTKNDIPPMQQGQTNEPTVSEVGSLAKPQAAPAKSNESALTRMLQALTSPSPATISDGAAPQPWTAITTLEGTGKTDVSPPAYWVAAQQAPAPSTSVQENIYTAFEQGRTDPSAPFTISPSSPSSTPLPHEPRTAATVFSAQDLKQAMDPALQTTPIPGQPGMENTDKQNGPLVVNNQYGQIITIQQTGEAEDEPTGAGSTAKTGPSVSESRSLDITNQYIHSHLPKETPQKGTEQNSEQELSSSSKNQQSEVIKATNSGSEAQPSMEPLPLLKGQPGVTQENQPLLFAHQRSITPMSAGSTTVESSSYRLPSGMHVPEGTVVDQMIAHFSLNKRLESGTVNLRLYPQELGELRMEIRVEQDNIKAHIVAQSPQAQEMIDRHLPRLRESLEQQGLHLQQIEVTVAANDNASNERYPGSSGWQQSGHPAGSKAQHPIFSMQNNNEASEDRSVANTLSVVA